jgi:hypothetical protein
MEGVTTIYALKHPETDTVRYIGKTGGILTLRVKGHLRGAKKGGRNHRYDWIRSLPSPPVIVPILVTEDRYGAAAERFAIALYRAAGDDLVNGTDGGEGTSGRIATPAQRAAMSAMRKGKKLGPQTPEQRAVKSRANRGKKRSLAQRAAISTAQKGRKLSPEHRRAIGFSQAGKKKSPEHCAAISASLTGRKLSLGHRAALSESHRGRIRGPYSSEHCAAISAGKRKKV